MRRLVLALLLGMPVSSQGQDMPLSQILPDDSKWQRSKEKPFSPHDLPGALADRKDAHAARVPDGPWFMTLPDKTGVFRVDEANVMLMQLPVKKATGLAVWPDGGTLVVGDSDDRHLWAFRITKDGSLCNGEPYYTLRLRQNEEKSGVTDLAADPVGRIYAATPLGVQVFDTTGRLSGVLTKPGNGSLSHVRVFANRNPPILSVICGGNRFDRPLKASGMKPLRK